MIDELDSTLRNLLIKRGKMGSNKIKISFDQPTGEWASRLGSPTVNLWCFDVRENVKLRNMETRISDKGDGRTARMRLPPLRFDLSYLVTAWAREVEDEHKLLWQALGALALTKTLPKEFWEGNIKKQPYEIPISVAQASDSVVNVSDLWSVLDNQMRLGFVVTATLALDLEQEFEELVVLERRIAVGQSDSPPDHELDALDYQIVRRVGEKERQERERRRRDDADNQ